MDEGVFRVLRALATRERVPFDAVPRRAGEAASVVKDFARERAAWIDATGEGLRLADAGLVAYALEAAARARAVAAAPDEVLARFAAIARARGPARRDLDQVYATPESSVLRARRLVEAGEAQRGLLLLGDDDLTSVAVALLEPGRRVTVVEVDPAILALLDRAASEHGFDLRVVAHDLRDPLPRELAGKAGCVATDPPYAIEGFRLFVTRALEALRPGGRAYVSFGWSGRSKERGLAKQRALLEAGLCIEEALRDFTEYDGAESIGGRSTLFVCARTNEGRPLVRGRAEGDLYSRRKPRPPKKP